MAYLSGYRHGYISAADTTTPVVAATGVLSGVGTVGAAGPGRPAITALLGLSGSGRVSTAGAATLEQYVYQPTPPPYVPQRTTWRYIAQRILTEEFLSWAVPITTTGPGWDLSGPGNLTGTISPELGQLRDPAGVPILEEWSTAIYAEADGEIRWGGILIRSGFNGPEWELELAGFTTYPNGFPYSGGLYSKIQVNPMDVVKYLWDWVQAQPDANLGMGYELPTNCPVRMGVPAIPAYDEVMLTGTTTWVKKSDAPASKVYAAAAAPLAAAMTATQTSLTLTTLSNFGKMPLPSNIKIGAEALTVTGRSGLKLTVTRGLGTSSATAHSKGTNVTYIGTATRTIDQVDAEPYELAWWDSTDVGAEISKLAQETPFDYREEHYWTDAAAFSVESPIPAAAAPVPPPPVATWRVGYGNLHGGYDGTDKNWMSTYADRQVDLLGSMGVSIFGAVELHEETSTAMPQGAHLWWLGRVRAKLGNKWALAEGAGGDHALYDSTVHALVSSFGGNLAGDTKLRKHGAFQFRHITTGALHWFFVDHFHADDTDDTSRSKERALEATALVKYTAGKTPGVLVGDFNSVTLSAGYPRAILLGDGWKGLQQRTTPANGDLGSDSGTDGQWIEDIMTRDAELTLSNAAGVKTNGVTDHQLWLQATVTLKPQFMPTIVDGAAVQVTSPSTKRVIGHRLVVGYPRLGRRRTDLAFIEGANVSTVVPITRNGDDFANVVVGIGKGEGAASLRAEVAVRDGRLRRPAVYVDKAAGTSARLSSLARQEWARRQLLPEIGSITVDEHPNARIGSWAVGDDILVRAELPWVGYVEIWSRVTAWTLQGESRATLTLQRSDTFNYGQPAQS